ncbi:unnamed protein product [Amoebophrya sp. A120]|nr:unnamed protein product [Amoebophrya sp. A120]|eukprot:GSA120T00013070001.1
MAHLWVLLLLCVYFGRSRTRLGSFILSIECVFCFKFSNFIGISNGQPALVGVADPLSTII